MIKIGFLLNHKNDEKRKDIYNLTVDLINNRIQDLKKLLSNSSERWLNNLSKFSSGSPSDDEHESHKNLVTYEIPQTDKYKFGDRDPLFELL